VTNEPCPTRKHSVPAPKQKEDQFPGPLTSNV
jgi:hypothetical protein